MSSSFVSRIGATLCALLWAASLGCAEQGAERCESRILSQSVSAENRFVLGVAAPYPADNTLRAREELLRDSQKARREAAWTTVAKVLAPVVLAKNIQGSVDSLPRFQTWYGAGELQRMFQRLVAAQSSSEKLERAPFLPSSLDETFLWNAQELNELENWSEERKEEYFASIDSEERVSGLGGIGAVSYSGSAARHILESYSEVLQCMASGVPAPIAEGPASEQMLLRETIALASCETQVFGPFALRPGEELRAVSDEIESSRMRFVREGGVGGDDSCGSPCVAEEGGVYYLHVDGELDAISGTVEVRAARPEAPWSACLQSAFPGDSVVVKASWHRTQFQNKLPRFDTSASALQARMKGNQDWGEGDGEVDPLADTIYTVELANGQRYRLAALHIMTKELDHWQWTSLWWSDDPDSDFGEDRPEFVRDLAGPWKNYKMCTATHFLEGDDDPSGGYAESHPSLAAALASVHQGVGGPSFCSNPYLEEGRGNQATNCIGCHQHAGTDLRSEDILSDSVLFPERGRTELRNNFPHDYSFAITQGDQIERMMKNVVDFFAE